MCEFHGSNGNGFGDIWWTANPIYFSSIDFFQRRAARVQEGERNSRRDVRSETDGREETGGTGKYGSGVRRPGESF